MITVLLAEAYVRDEGSDEYWLEGQPVRVEVEDMYESNGVSQVRVGVLYADESQEAAGVYLSLSSARDLMVGLGAAISAVEERE